MKTNRLRTVEWLASILPVLVGAAALLGWVLDIPHLKSVMPGMATMKANTALCFIVTGMAFWIICSGKTRGKANAVAVAFSVLVLLISGLTLGEYQFHWNLGLDETLFRDLATARDSFPGRMAADTAIAFVLLSVALLILQGRPKRVGVATACWLSGSTTLLGLSAVLGWIGATAVGYGRSTLTTMSLQSGVLFVLLGSASLLHVWSNAGLSLAIRPRLLAGFGIGLSTFAILSIFSYRSQEQLAETTEWVQHTYEVMARLASVQADFFAVQAAVRGFVITEGDHYPGDYYAALRKLQDDERTLRQLTADNPRQQKRLIAFETLIRQREAFSETALYLRLHSGFAPAAELIAGGSGEEIMKHAGVAIAAMEGEERSLLVWRKAKARTVESTRVFILSVGTFIDLGLLLTVLFFLNLEATDRREAEATSRLGAEIVRSANDAVITKTLSGIITSWSPGAERILGYSPEEAVGRPVQMLIPAECAAEERPILTKIERGERVDPFESLRLRKDGRLANVSISVSPLKDNNGRIVGAVKILRDITERKLSEEALRGSEERFQTMANSISQLAWIARADGYIHWYNQRWYEYTGKTFAQMEGWGWQTVHDPEMLPKVLANWTAAINSGEPFEMEFPLLGADGKFHAFLTRMQPSKDAAGRVLNWFGTNTDIDELKRMQESLRTAQTRLNSTLAASSIGTWTWDIGKDCLTGDEFFARIFATDPAAAAQGLPAAVYLRAVMEEDQAAVGAALALAIQSCGRYDAEYRVRQENGEFHWLQAKGRVEADAAGNAVLFHGAVMDITERKRTEARFRRLIDSNAQGVMFWNQKGAITRANDAFLQIVGYSREDQERGLIDWAAMTPLEYAVLDQRALDALAARGIAAPYEKEYIRKDGSRVPILLGAAMFEDSLDEGICFVLDITERKQTESALRESEGHFRFLNDLSNATRNLADPALIMAVTARMLGEHLGVSRCAYANIGQDGEHFSILHDYTDGRATVEGNYPLSLLGSRAVATLQSGQTLVIRESDAEVLPGDGADTPHPMGGQAIIICPIVKDGGLRAMMAVAQTKPRGWKPLEVVLVQDVVERCWALVERGTAEENIRRINAELEQRVAERTAAAAASNRAKSVFLSTMSHEIRTPMNAILGYTQLMLRDPLLGADAQANLRIINRSGEHLLALINDVLDMSRIEAGQLEINRTTFSLAKLFDDVAGMFRLRAEAKGLRFEVTVDSTSAPYIVADEGKMRQILINLVGNAIKFTDHGYIKLQATLHQFEGDNASLSACVEDTGAGISDNDQKKLFQSFSQTQSGISSQQGTGLGLAISRSYARLMGGDVTCTSIPGAGSAFHLDVPVERGDAQVAIRRSSPRRVIGLRGGQDVPRVLIVDDLIENRDWLMKLLSAIGFSVTCADNGEAAVRDWRKWAPRLILMDIHMPVMDGLEATRRIKAEPGGQETAIVILTASVLEKDRRRVQQSGADDFLAKPCLEAVLLEKIGTLLKIDYDYEELSEAETVSPGHMLTSASEIPATTLASLKKLPHELSEALRNATADGDKKLLNSLIASVDQTEYAQFARDLQNLADRYEYDALMRLLSTR